MSDVMNTLLSGGVASRPSIPGTAPLICLTLYLFHEFEDEESRVKEINDLFYHYRDSQYMQEITDALQSDKNAYACYQAATQAVEEGLIEVFDADFDSDFLENEGDTIAKVYTVSFLEWAEKSGYTLPEYVMPDIKQNIEYYYYGRMSREVTRQNFSKIDDTELEKRMSEPLWIMTDALLYVLGYKNKQSEDRKINFLKYKKNVQKIRQYVQDAQKTGELKLFDYNDYLFDIDRTDMEKKRETAFFACKVKPKEFIKWLYSMPINLPIIEKKNTKEKNDKAIINQPEQHYEYDVALSFAGEDREYVEKVAKKLELSGVKVFYDKFQQTDLWGKDLYVHLDDVYRKKARYCVMFLSIHYKETLWTDHERESAQARAFQNSEPYILPVKFDDTEIPGIRPTTGYLPIADMEADVLVEHIIKKLEDSKTSPMVNPDVR